MVDQNLLTIFIALTGLAVLLQTGIFVGFYYVTTKLMRQADQALDMSQTVLVPVRHTIENIQAVTTKLAELSGKMPGQMRQAEQWIQRRAA